MPTSYKNGKVGSGSFEYLTHQLCLYWYEGRDGSAGHDNVDHNNVNHGSRCGADTPNYSSNDSDNHCWLHLGSASAVGSRAAANALKLLTT